MCVCVFGIFVQKINLGLFNCSSFVHQCGDRIFVAHAGDTRAVLIDRCVYVCVCMCMCVLVFVCNGSVYVC